MNWNEFLDLLVLFEISVITSVILYNLIVYGALYFWSTVSFAFQYLYRNLLVEFPRATHYNDISQFFFSDSARVFELAAAIALLAIDHYALAHKVKKELERETSVLLQEVVASTGNNSSNEQPEQPGEDNSDEQ